MYDFQTIKGKNDESNTFKIKKDKRKYRKIMRNKNCKII